MCQKGICDLLLRCTGILKEFDHVPVWSSFVKTVILAVNMLLIFLWEIAVFNSIRNQISIKTAATHRSRPNNKTKNQSNNETDRPPKNMASLSSASLRMWVCASSMEMRHPCMQLEPTLTEAFCSDEDSLLVMGSDSVCPMTMMYRYGEVTREKKASLIKTQRDKKTLNKLTLCCL